MNKKNTINLRSSCISSDTSTSKYLDFNKQERSTIISNIPTIKSEEVIIGMFSLLTLGWSASCFFHLFGQWAIIPTLCIAGLISFTLSIGHTKNSYRSQKQIFRLPQTSSIFQKGEIKRRKKRFPQHSINTKRNLRVSRESMTTMTV